MISEIHHVYFNLEGVQYTVHIYVKSCKIFSCLYYLRKAFPENLEESNDKKWQNEYMYMKYDTDN